MSVQSPVLTPAAADPHSPVALLGAEDDGVDLVFSSALPPAEAVPPANVTMPVVSLAAAGIYGLSGPRLERVIAQLDTLLASERRWLATTGMSPTVCNRVYAEALRLEQRYMNAPTALTTGADLPGAAAMVAQVCATWHI